MWRYGDNAMVLSIRMIPRVRKKKERMKAVLVCRHFLILSCATEQKLAGNGVLVIESFGMMKSKLFYFWVMK
jgi:hypothetical protein